MKNIFAGMCLASLAITSNLALAATEDSDLPHWLSERITPVHYGLTTFVDNTSRSIDAFFGTDESQYADNKSFMRFSSELRLVEGNSEADIGLRFKLDLPTTRRKLRLIIESDADEPLVATNQNNTNRFTEINQFDASNSILGLEQGNEKNPNEAWRTRFGVGIKLRSPIDPYVRVTSTRQWDFENSPWQSNFNGRVTYFNEEGYVTRASFDIGRPLAADRAFRLLTQVEWQQERDEVVYVQSAEINRILDQRSALRYAALLVGDTARSKDLYDRVLQVYYRRDIHKKFLFADIIPELHFPTEDGTKPFAALTLRLEMYFRGDFRPAVKTSGGSSMSLSALDNPLYNGFGFTPSMIERPNYGIMPEQ